jgi:hypothetical protein
MSSLLTLKGFALVSFIMVSLLPCVRLSLAQDILVENIRLSVRQESYPYTLKAEKRPNILALAMEILKRNGLSVVDTSPNDGGVSLTINIVGKPTCETYNNFFENFKSCEGAEISGTIVLNGPENSFGERNFYGKVSPKRITRKLKSRHESPFQKALARSNFESNLTDLIKPLLPTNPVPK